MKSLYYARNADEARELIERGADISAEDQYGFSILHSLAYICNSEVAEVLIDHGACLDTKDINGYSPLHVAAEKGCAEMVELLLEKGSSVNTIDMLGETALIKAYKKGHDEVVSILAEYLFDNNMLISGKTVICQNSNSSLVLYTSADIGSYPLWFLVKDAKPDFTHLYIKVREDSGSGSLICTKLDGTEWYTSVINNKLVEKIRELESGA